MSGSIIIPFYYNRDNCSQGSCRDSEFIDSDEQPRSPPGFGSVTFPSLPPTATTDPSVSPPSPEAPLNRL